MTYQHISWHGGTKPRRPIQDRDQSEEPPAEYWERREREQDTKPADK